MPSGSHSLTSDEIGHRPVCGGRAEVIGGERNGQLVRIGRTERRCRMLKGLEPLNRLLRRGGRAHRCLRSTSRVAGTCRGGLANVPADCGRYRVWWFDQWLHVCSLSTSMVPILYTGVDRAAGLPRGLCVQGGDRHVQGGEPPRRGRARRAGERRGQRIRVPRTKSALTSMERTSRHRRRMGPGGGLVRLGTQHIGDDWIGNGTFAGIVSSSSCVPSFQIPRAD